MSKKIVTILASVGLGLSCLLFFLFLYKGQETKATGNESANETLKQVVERDHLIKPTATETEKNAAKAEPKTMEEKQAVMEADRETMESYGLYYDYANMGLVEVVQAYLAEAGIDPSSIAFTYQDIATGDTFSLNDTQPMTAGSTYKLPLNMLVVDEVEKGKLSLTEKFDITHTDYEYEGEHDNYVAAFAGEMTIPDMQEYSLVYSENTPAYALAERLGGMEKAFSMFDRYGKSKSAEIPTISQENKTTTSYYIQVLDYLWKHQEKYQDLLNFIGISFPGEYYKMFVNGVTIYQKPGYVREALNVDAIIMEKSPYLVSLYTAGLGGTTPESNVLSAVGMYQVGQICYVINEWHRVNMNNG
ncbi:serine hydrolase [Streptococcus pneumoniae]